MSWLFDLIVFIDSHFWLRKLLDCLGVLLTGLLALAPLYGKGDVRKPRWWQRSWLFLAFLILVLFNCRWAAIFCPKYFDIDEANLVTQALTFEHYPVPWRDVDPATSGPINGYALLWGVPFGISPSYASARAMGLFCFFGLMTFLYLTGRRIAGEVPARISILPLFLFLCFAISGDYICYSTEQTSLFLIGWAIYLLSHLRASRSVWMIVGFGLVVGLLPFAKLQSLVPAVGLDLGAMVLLIVECRSNFGKAFGRCALLLLSTIIPGAILLSVVASYGAFSDFWRSYIEVAQFYGKHSSTAFGEVQNKIYLIYRIFDPGHDTALSIYLMGGTGIIVGASLIVGRLKATRIANTLFLFSAYLALVMVVTVLSPNLFYVHYHYFLFPALGLLTLASFRILQSQTRKLSERTLTAVYRMAAITACVLIGFLAMFVLFYNITYSSGSDFIVSFCFSCFPLAAIAGVFMVGATVRPHATGAHRQQTSVLALWIVFFAIPAFLFACLPNQFRGQMTKYAELRYSPMDLAVLKFRPPGGRMAIWGWDPEFAAETGTPLGTRDSFTEWAIEANPLAPYFQQRYVHDLKANRPELFLEAVGPGAFRYKDSRAGFAYLPELAQLIAQQYQLVATIDGMRLFIRDDLASTHDFLKTQN